jgi:hypothetical protein
MTSVKVSAADWKSLPEIDIYNDSNPKAKHDLDFDIEKLNSYFLIELWITEIIDGNYRSYSTPFRKCNSKDFE